MGDGAGVGIINLVGTKKGDKDSKKSKGLKWCMLNVVVLGVVVVEQEMLGNIGRDRGLKYGRHSYYLSYHDHITTAVRFSKI